MENDLQEDNVVEIVREIRNRNYEATKHMTCEERRKHNRKRYEKAKANFEKRTATLKPSYDIFMCHVNETDEVEKHIEEGLPIDAVERVRAIRNRRYEETKHMTHEEKRAYDKQRTEKSVAEFKQRTANLKPDYDRFPFLAPKKTQ
jgi:hypothetical protein